MPPEVFTLKSIKSVNALGTVFQWIFFCAKSQFLYMPPSYETIWEVINSRFKENKVKIRCF